MKFVIMFMALIFSVTKCGNNISQNNTMTQPKYTNSLINETSPYLLQHAHNPVNWYPWNEQSLKKAKDENKPILVSIGYSACHWCHVMEHESFEDTTVAKLMNEFFICIKVDREERPDIDQIYMNAVQLMNQSGGWPLNCFATPNGKPFWGGTYFPKQQWIQILTKINEEWVNNPKKIIDFSERLTQGIQQSELITFNESKPDFHREVLDVTVNKWKQRFDNQEGGPNKAPKFPLPNNYQFLLGYYQATKDIELLKHIRLTLDKMAFGGIYDQIGGGFARYSTDTKWKVPHFEKMLYDNAQLISLYTEAFVLTKEERYKEIVFETINFVRRELLDSSGAFYSALDADSEGIEGKYYIWTKEELEELLTQDFKLFADYYNVNNKGYWEHDAYILLKTQTDEEFATAHNLKIEELNILKSNWKQLLLAERNKRIKPGLDDKSLTSWNGLMLKALCDAYAVFEEPYFLSLAENNARFITNVQMNSNGRLNHSYKNGKSTINGYLEDYCFTISGLIALYEVTFEEEWLEKAKTLVDYSIEHFHDSVSQMFYFTSDKDNPLIARKMEVSDNVIPSSNSEMAKCLFLLGHIYDNKLYIEIAKNMLNNIQHSISTYGSAYSNWCQLLLYFTEQFYEIAIVGDNCTDMMHELSKFYYPNKLFVGSKNENESIPLLLNKSGGEKSTIYVCQNNSCQAPTQNPKTAISQLK